VSIKPLLEETETETIPALYHPGYESWRSMHQRCKSKNYREAGITVCAQWSTFTAFWRDMGETWFDGAELDRIDNFGIYEPENCQWLTHAEHSRKSAQQKSKSLRKKIGNNGTSPEQIDPKSGPAQKLAYKVAEVAAMFGVSEASIYRAINAGNLRPLKGFGQSLIPQSEIDRFANDTEARPARKR